MNPSLERRFGVQAERHRSPPAVELVPDLLRALADFIGAHGGMGREHLGTHLSGDQPVAGDGNVADHRRVFGLLFFPTAEVDGAGERSHHDELGEGDARFERHLDGGVEGSAGLSVGRPKNERTEHVNAMLFERLQLACERLTGVVPILNTALRPWSDFAPTPTRAPLILALRMASR